jgi:peptidoglycan/LPS O-acetylase OafA/YrhL
MTATHGLKLPKALVALGDMSFSVYLIHSPVLYVVKGMLVHFAGADVRLNDRGGKILTDPPLVAAYFTASLAVTLLLSHFSYAFIERKLSGLLLGKLVSSAHAAPRNQ